MSKKNNHCIICGKLIWDVSTKCQSCTGKDMSKRMKENNPMKNPEVAKKVGKSHRLILPEGEIISLYGKISASEIAKRFNCSSDPVCRILKENNIKLKPKGYFTKGRPFTEEHRKNLSLSETGEKNHRYGTHQSEELNKKQSLRMSGKNNPFYGKQHTEETKRMLRGNKERNKKISISKMGDKNPNWKGGKSFEPYGLDFNEQFKEMVKDRDNYTCQLCKKQKSEIKRLQVHHINYVKTDNFTFNAITLCGSCHNLTGSNRGHWTKFFQDYLRDKYGYTFNLRQKKINEDIRYNKRI